MLGAGEGLDEYLAVRLGRALDRLRVISPDLILQENVDVLVAELCADFFPTEIVVQWDSPTQSGISEATKHIQDHFDTRRTYSVAASRIVISFPVTGSVEMLNYRASTWTMAPEYGRIADGRVVIEIVEQQLSAERIKSEIAQVRSSLSQRITFANNDLAKFRTTAELDLREAVGARRKRILDDRALAESLDIPVHPSSTPPAVVATRKHVSLETRAQQAEYVPEPVLEDAIYQEIVQQVRSWANTIERSPKAYSQLGEEGLRDLLLGTLNSNWQGAAGGEFFNGAGKTDVLVRYNDRNAFIAECKIWKGPQTAGDALDQLLSYLVWRDSKAALIMFIKTKDPAATIGRMHDAIEGHASHLLTKDASNRSSRGDYVIKADEEGRRVSLAVIPVVIPAL